MKRASSFQAFQNIYKVSRRNSQSVQPCNNLGKSRALGHFGERNTRIFLNRGSGPWDHNRLAIGEGVGLDDQRSFFDAQRQIALGNSDTRQAHVVTHDNRSRALIDDNALIDALNSGQIGHATLDTFRIEPLPADHPYWAHPKVTVTPHCASETRPASASRIIAENIARGESGQPFLHLVDRDSGY